MQRGNWLAHIKCPTSVETGDALVPTATGKHQRQLADPPRSASEPSADLSFGLSWAREKGRFLGPVLSRWFDWSGRRDSNPRPSPWQR